MGRRQGDESTLDSAALKYTFYSLLGRPWLRRENNRLISNMGRMLVQIPLHPSLPLSPRAKHFASHELCLVAQLFPLTGSARGLIPSLPDTVCSDLVWMKSCLRNLFYDLLKWPAGFEVSFLPSAHRISTFLHHSLSAPGFYLF